MAKISRKTAVKKGTSKKSASVSSKKIQKKSPADKPLKKAAHRKAAHRKAAVKKAVRKPAKSTSKPDGSKALAKTNVRAKVQKSASEILSEAAIHGILEKKGKNVICMDLRKIPNAVCDYFIICEADSTRQVNAIADSVDFQVKSKTGENPFHTEGWQNSVWILLDYVSVVVHVFEAETRHFYNLERLWADAEVKEYGVEYA